MVGFLISFHLLHSYFRTRITDHWQQVGYIVVTLVPYLYYLSIFDKFSYPVSSPLVLYIFISAFY